MTVGWDLSDGVETHVEATFKDGHIYITDSYQIVDGTCEHAVNERSHTASTLSTNDEGKSQ